MCVDCDGVEDFCVGVDGDFVLKGGMLFVGGVGVIVEGDVVIY